MRIKDYFHATVGSADKGDAGGEGGEGGGEEGTDEGPRSIPPSIGKDPPPLSPDEEHEKTTILFRILPGLVVFAALYFAVTGALCLGGFVSLGGKTHMDALKTFADKLEFTMKYQVLGMLWLVIWVLVVVGERIYTGALNPLAKESREEYVQYYKNIMTNSVEQFLLSAFAQIIMIASLDGECTHKSIPWINFSFLLGRITYAAGYPRYRLFGLQLSLYPIIGMTAIGIYKLGAHFFC